MRLQVSGASKRVAGASPGWAVVMTVLGLLTVILSSVAETTISLIIGSIAALTGIVYVSSAIADRHAGALVCRLLIGISYLAGGVYVVFRPPIALDTLTAIIVSIFSLEGVLELVTFFQIRPLAGSIWALLDATFTLLLAFALALPWPNNSYRAVGIILGINLVVTGFSVLMYSLATSKPIDQFS